MSDELKPTKKRSARHAARLAAVQALYQLSQVDLPSAQVLEQFLKYRLGQTPDQEHDLIVDKQLFQTIYNTACNRREEVDQLISAQLADDWKIERLDSVLQSVLRAGCAELLTQERPAIIIIDEFVTVAKEFFFGHEPGFVNGVLDHIARDLKLDMRENSHDREPAVIEDFSHDAETSGISNWEGEGGSN